ncbi:hypothetical protein [Flavobacterium filum]|uniref:hypothetical protein n=1 Tax=Flavobacterium filum TaxID=370974 RepID=UPI0023F2E4E9|nr:hypothetical protein [Flavobacterium filum]
MIINGKEIKPEKVSMWINLLGFLAGIIFYIRMENKSNQGIVAPANALKDSALVINTELQLQVKRLKQTQDSLIQEIQKTERLLSKQKQTTLGLRKHIQQQLGSDWQSLSPEQQNAYIQEVISSQQKK